jgi:hypothetical protein
MATSTKESIMKININICGCTIANIESDDKKVLSRAICAVIVCDDDGIGSLLIDNLIIAGKGCVMVDDYLVSVVAA